MKEAKKILNPETFRAVAPILRESSVKLEIGKRFIDHIVNRTLGGKDKEYSKFAGYSNSYKKSDVFKIYKGSQRTVDLQLTGAMLASLFVSKVTTTGFELEVGEDQQPKASGHIYGDNPNGMPVRDFWGLPSEDDKKKIINDAVREFNVGKNELALAMYETLSQQVENEELLLFEE